MIDESQLPKLYPEEYATGMLLPDANTQRRMNEYGKACYEAGIEAQKEKDRQESTKRKELMKRLLAEARKEGAEEMRQWIIKWGNTRCLNAQHGSAYFKGQCVKCWQSKLKGINKEE